MQVLPTYIRLPFCYAQNIRCECEKQNERKKSNGVVKPAKNVNYVHVEEWLLHCIPNELNNNSIFLLVNTQFHFSFCTLFI